MATEFNTGSDASLNEAVKSRYEANSDTNAFTDGEKSKLAAIPSGAEPNSVDSVNGATGAVVLNADDIDDASTAHKFATAAQLTKIDGVEANATADQSGAEIVSAIDTELGGTTWQSGGAGGGGPVATVSDVAQDRILGRISAGAGNSEELTATDVRALLNVADGATANSGALADVNTVDTAQIDNNAVTLGKLAQVASARLLGRDGAGTGNVEALTAADVIALLGLNSTANGAGASQIGVEDAGAFFLSTTVEAALGELATTLDGYGTAVTLDQEDIVLQGGQDVVIYDAGGDSTAARPSQPATKTVIWFNHGSSLPVNMGTFDIAIGGGFGVVPVNTQSGTVYTLVQGDAGANVDATSAAANTITIPTNASVSFAIGTCVSVTQLGAGTTTVEGAPGVSVNGSPGGSVTLNNQFSGCVIRKTAADAWVIQGDVS